MPFKYTHSILFSYKSNTGNLTAILIVYRCFKGN